MNITQKSVKYKNFIIQKTNSLELKKSLKMVKQLFLMTFVITIIWKKL